MGINSTFKEAVERATSPTLLEPDWVAILQVCDSIRQQDVTGKIAVNEIKKKIFDSNPHVSKNAIITLEACVKNCGAIIHEEVASKLLMDDFRQYLKICPDTVKAEILRIIQAWAHGFRNEPKYKVIEDTRNLLKMEGYSFPERNESDAMFSALKAPDWVDGDVCHRCRVKFTTFNRQHHCRCCGQVFCAKCSSKVSTIPKFGIERDVRVCDPCHEQLNTGERSSASSQPPGTTTAESDLPAEYLKSDLAKESQVPEKKSADEIKRQEQEDLQLAMALSVSEQDSKQTSRPSSQLSSLYAVPETKPSAPAIPSSYSYSSPSMEEEKEVDPELARYLNRPYWEGRKEANDTPSSNERPVVSTTSVNEEPARQQTPQDRESEAFMESLRTNIKNLTQRMKYVTGKGRHVSTDTITQSLLQTVNTMHPQLMAVIEQQELEKEKYEGMQDKLGVLEETRQSLDGLRTQRREKLRQQEMEQDMLRRMQMEQKMDLLRQQKQEYMLYQQQLQAQRQQALEQRIKEQMPNYPVTSSYGMYQPAPQYPVSQDTKAPLPDSYTQATYNPAGEVPPQYQPGQPPAYQSVTSGAHPTGTAGPLQKQAQPPPYRTSTNQYEPPVTQYQNMSLQSENPPPAYQPSVQPAPNQAHQQPNNQPPPSHAYQSHMNQLQQPGMRQQNMQPAVSQPQYPQPGGQAPAPLPQSLQLQHPSQANQAPPSNKPQTQQPVGHYQNPAMRGSPGSYLDGDAVADSPQSMGPRQELNVQGYPMEPEYPSSGQPSFQGQQALQNVYNRTPPSSGPPSMEHFPGQTYNPQQGPPPQQGGLPPQQGGPPPQQGGPPPQQGPPPPHYGQALQQGPLSSGPPSLQYPTPPSSGPPSLQYSNPPSEPTGPYPGSQPQAPGGQQQSWGQPPSGNYAQQPVPPPSYPGYEPVQQPYGQPPPPQQQYYDQNVVEAQLISFD